MINFNKVFQSVKEAYSLSDTLLSELSEFLIPNSEGMVPVCKEKTMAAEVVSFRKLIESTLAHVDKYGIQHESIEELQLCVQTFCLWVKDNFKNHQVLSEWVLESLNYAFDQKGVV